MAVAARLTTTPAPGISLPYITTAEYLTAPTGVDVSNLVRNNPGGTEAELANKIRQATAWINGEICGQTIAATADTETARVALNRDGAFVVHPRYFPILEVTSFGYGGSPQSLVTLSDLSNLWIEPQQFTVPLTSGWTSAGPLQFGPSVRVGGKAFCQYGYVSGFPHTLLTATASAGGTSIQVADATGILPGLTQLVIYDAGQTETVTVSSSYTLGSATVALAVPLTYDHGQVGISVSAVPSYVKEACILLTSTLIQTRGAVALIAPAVGGVSSRYTQSGSQRSRNQKVPVDDNEELARKMLLPLTRPR